MDVVAISKDVLIPLVAAGLAFLGGRKSKSQNKKDEFEALAKELEAFKNFRQLLIDDNNSLVTELKAMKIQVKDLDEQLKSLIKKYTEERSNCAACQTKAAYDKIMEKRAKRKKPVAKLIE